LGYVLPVPNYDIYSMPLKAIVADILVALAGHVSCKLFLGEYWTGASSDFQQVRSRIMVLADLGYFGVHPMRVEEVDQKIIDRFWAESEEQVGRLLTMHADEVHALANALLEKGDLSSAEVYALLKPRESSVSVAGKGDGREPVGVENENSDGAGRAREPKVVIERAQNVKEGA
jgi:ATP-dependent Zn protease